MLTDFAHWYPLAEAATHAPASAGVFQVKVSRGLLAYPGGKSAMVHYGSSDNLRDAVSQVARDHAEGTFMCRHQSSDAPSVLLDFVAGQFVRRFGVMPSWPTTSFDSGATS